VAEKPPVLPWPTAGTQATSSGTKDKRSSLRRGGNPIAVVVSDALVPGDPAPGLVVNRSRGGLCLMLPRKFDVGQLVAVRSGNFPKEQPSVQLRVRHCKQIGDRWRLGCQFVEDLPWSTVLLFG
jgi:hypothetical protein